jgi:putative peptidoglycan lipid II flippase
MRLFPAIATVGGFTMLSRLLGFARDILIAAVLGAGPVADAFFVAFKLPNFFRRLFAEGAFNAGFVPLFASVLETEGRAAARRFAESALSVLVVALALLVGAFEMAMPVAMYGLAPGFAADPAKFDLTVELTRLTFPYLLFISIVSLMGGVLNSLGRFAAVAAAPILLNLCLIGAILLLTPWVATPGHALAWGVAGAGACQFLWVSAALARAGMPLRLPRPRFGPHVRQLLRLMAPAAVGAGVVQINLVVDVVLASLLPGGSVSYLFYADRLNQLPIGVIGVAVGTALLPALSRSVAAGDEPRARHDLNRALEVALVLTLPAAAAFAVCAEPLVAALFERGAFGSRESSLTAAALVAYSAGLPAYVLVKVLTPAFFARHDTRTPLRYAMIAVAANLALNLLLMGPLLHVGLALATALAAWLNVGLLGRRLVRDGILVADPRLRRRSLMALVATACMAAALLAYIKLGAGWFDSTGIARLVALGGLVATGLATYAGAAHVTGAATLGDLRSLLRPAR